MGHFTKLQKDVNQHADYWVLEVLLEEEAFSEGNLTELFKLLGKRFADRPGLVVNVFTSLKALRTPEEYDRTDLCCLRKDYRKYKYAIYNRDDNGERFVYEIPGRQPRKEVFLSRSDK